MAERLDLEPESIDPRTAFADLGLDSAMTVELTLDLEDLLARPIDSTQLWNFSTLETLSAFLGRAADHEDRHAIAPTPHARRPPDTTRPSDALAAEALDALSEQQLAQLLATTTHPNEAAE